MPRPSPRNKLSFQQMVSGQWIFTCKMWLNSYIIPYKKINSKMNQRPKFKIENSKILRRRHRSKSSWHWLRQWFPTYYQKHRKQNKNRWSLSKLEILVFQRVPPKWGNIYNSCFWIWYSDIYPFRYPEYIKNAYNSARRR